MIRVTFIVTSTERAGAQVALLRLLPLVALQGFEPSVISLATPNALSEEFARAGVPLHHLGVPPSSISLRALGRLVGLLKEDRPDLVQGWMYHGNLAAQLASFLIPNSPPVIWGIRGTNTILTRERKLTALTIWLGGRLSARPEAIIYNSRASAREHASALRYRREREVVIPNGFDTTQFVPSPEARARIRTDLGVPNDAVLIGLVARFHQDKDHRTFLKALSRVHGSHPEVRAVLVGSGTNPANANLEALIAETRTQDLIYLLGERSDMPKVAAAFDIACNSSVSEAFPNAVGEAMSCGVPCVVTDVGDSRWLIGDTGRVVQPATPEALAKGLSELVQLGPERRGILGAHARERIANEFSIQATAERYALTYQTVIRRGFV